MIKNEMRTALPMAALDSIPKPNANAQSITGLVKQKGRIIGYQLSGGEAVSKETGIAMAKNGDIKGVGVAHRKNSEYLKSLPDSEESNNLSSLPSVSAKVLK